MDNDALAMLKPLIEPAPISWWPPAPGWWILACLLLLIIIGTFIFLWRRWRHLRRTAYQREASQLIDLLPSLPATQQLPLLAEILRRAAICAWGRENAGTKNWQHLIQFSHEDYLRRSGKKNTSFAFDNASQELLSHHLYNGTAPTDEALKTLIAQAKIWLKTLPPVEQ